MPRNVAIGLGLMEFPFAGVAGFWRWVDLCEAGGIDSLWQTDRMISREPILECMSMMAALAGRTRRLKFGVNVLSLAFRDPVLLAKQCATIDVSVRRAPVACFRHRQPAGARMADAQLRHQDARPQDRRRARNYPPAMARGRGRFRGRPLSSDRRLDRAKAGAARSADVDRRLVRGGDPAHRAFRHRLAGGRRNAGSGRRRSSPASVRPPPPKDERSTTTITGPASRSASVGPTSPVSPACLKLTASVPDATRCIILRSAMQARSSSGSPPMSMPGSPNSSCARRPAATRRCWGRRGG